MGIVSCMGSGLFYCFSVLLFYYFCLGFVGIEREDKPKPSPHLCPSPSPSAQPKQRRERKPGPEDRSPRLPKNCQRKEREESRLVDDKTLHTLPKQSAQQRPQTSTRSCIREPLCSTTPNEASTRPAGFPTLTATGVNGPSSPGCPRRRASTAGRACT
ncbi:hypothetical protein BC628DRAFT_1114634 [Trametes gibbosa]|nr:hypothetical protein BC628DRAFT_1114617 [Trametes gibbosa]KAI0829232.1 hypothetical protein BC628DRAFT_1114634 [Trametes gibbosa]